jgi:hypothetical protein
MDITTVNYQEAYDAIRDILFMYVDLVESYEGIGHNVRRGDFKALDYIDARVVEPEGYTFNIDETLLLPGAAISLLCELSDAWAEFETWDVKRWPLIYETKLAYEANRFSHLPDIEKAVALSFGSNQEAFREQLKLVYEAHVCSYFKRLTKCC